MTPLSPSLQPLDGISDDDGLVDLYNAWDVFVDVDREIAYVVSKSKDGLLALNVSNPRNIRPVLSLRHNNTLLLEWPQEFFVDVDRGLIYIASGGSTPPFK